MYVSAWIVAVVALAFAALGVGFWREKRRATVLNSLYQELSEWTLQTLGKL